MAATTTSAARAVREVLSREGILVGPSSGAVTHAALKFAERLERGNMVLMFADSGWKYLSSFGSSPPTPTANDDLDDVLWW